MSSLAFSEINSNDNLMGSSNMSELEKKRQVRHNITIKKRISHNTDTSMGSNMGSNMGSKNENVQSVLNLINNTNGYTDDSDDTGLADFSPPPRAEVSSKMPQAQPQPMNNEIMADYEKPIKIAYPPPDQKDYSETQKIVTAVAPRQYPLPLDSQSDFAALPKDYASNYYKQYVPFFNQNGGGAGAGSGPGGASAISGGNKDQLLEKLNYMIHLLEEKRDEKTGHVMEEVILYSFLGVFIIFIVDSFARAGKYTR